MTCSAIPEYPSRRFGILLTGLITILIMLSGCRQDQGVSAAATRGSDQAAAEREQALLEPLKDTLGQPTSPTDNTQTPSQPDSQTPLNGNQQASSGETTQAPSAQTIPQLSWSPPATREDGTSLYPSDISGYRIYYRLRYQSKFQTITINSADETQYALADMEPGAYEFAVSTLGSDGLESRKSSLVSVNII